MAKKAVSVTLDDANVRWLKGRARISGGNVSDALDKLITQARTGGRLAGPHTSVVGTIDLGDDPDLLKADAAVQAWFAESLSSPFEVHEEPPAPKAARRKKSRG